MFKFDFSFFSFPNFHALWSLLIFIWVTGFHCCCLMIKEWADKNLKTEASVIIPWSPFLMTPPPASFLFLAHTSHVHLPEMLEEEKMLSNISLGWSIQQCFWVFNISSLLGRQFISLAIPFVSFLFSVQGVKNMPLNRLLLHSCDFKPSTWLPRFPMLSHLNMSLG